MTPTGYSIAGYGEMIETGPRIQAYAHALQQAVRPGCVVLDIGAGAGIFSLLACKYGAGHVHAIEPDDSILLAREIAAANGFADRISFHQDLSSNITLPHKADVIVSDLRGVLPFYQHHITAIVDARARHLADGGRLIPVQDILWGAVVESPRNYQRYAEPWLANELGLDLAAGHPLVVNTWRKARVKPDELLVAPRKVTTVNYQTVKNPNMATELSWIAERSGTAHGLAIWFDAELGAWHGFTNAPGKPELIYGQAFFPFQAPVAVEATDQISIQLRADLVEGDYTWSWNTSVVASLGRGETKASFRQSTFLGDLLSPARLKHHAEGFVPVLSERAQIDQQCLALADGKAPLSEVADKLATQFPHVFHSRQDALAYAARFLGNYLVETRAK